VFCAFLPVDREFAIVFVFEVYFDISFSYDAGDTSSTNAAHHSSGFASYLWVMGRVDGQDAASSRGYVYVSNI
jgi:hypothetical protein